MQVEVLVEWPKPSEKGVLMCEGRSSLICAVRAEYLWQVDDFCAPDTGHTYFADHSNGQPQDVMKICRLKSIIGTVTQ